MQRRRGREDPEAPQRLTESDTIHEPTRNNTKSSLVGFGFRDDLCDFVDRSFLWPRERSTKLH